MPNFVKNEILEVVHDELAGAIQVSLSTRMKSEMAEIIKEGLLEILDDRVTEIARSEARRTINEQGFGCSAPKRKVMLNPWV